LILNATVGVENTALSWFSVEIGTGTNRWNHQRHCHTPAVHSESLIIHTYIHTNLYSAKIVERI